MPAIALSKVETRERLKPRRGPYWVRIERGAYVGYRKMSANTAGTWLVRSRNPGTGEQLYHALGSLDDCIPSERFDRAAKAARSWLNHLERGGSTKSTTVEQACSAYVKHLRSSGREAAAKDAEKRFERWIDGTPFGSKDLQKLTPSDAAAWRTRLTKTLAIPQDKKKPATRARSASSLNRDMTSLRAALNLALENGDATSDTAWKTKLKPAKDADGRRDVYLDVGQRRRLLAKAPDELAPFLHALCLVPLRPGTMAALKVGNFDARLATLTIGKDKGGHDRKITLPAATAEFFGRLCKDRKAHEPILARTNGRPWDKDSWKYPVKEAVIAAELPVSVTAYALRHSTITDLIALHRLDTLTVAQLSGTSLAMIERHYGHLLREHAAKALEALAL